jgi:uncharacterized protein (DUF952 family)
MIIFHIVLPEVWEKFKDKDFYEAESLQTEGFIHCSFAEQIETVLNRYYRDTERVLLLEIETEKLTSRLINEPSTGGEIYPHIYGKINAEAIVGNKERLLKCK